MKKITLNTINEVRCLSNKGYTPGEIASKLGLSEFQVVRILNVY